MPGFGLETASSPKTPLQERHSAHMATVPSGITGIHSKVTQMEMLPPRRERLHHRLPGSCESKWIAGHREPRS